MNRLDRYVGRTVLVAILLVLAIIVGLDAFAAILNEVEDVSESYTFGEVGLYVLLTLPGRPETEGFVQATIGDTGASRVIPIHFDSLFRAIDKPVKVLGLARFGEFVETTREVLPDVTIETLPVAKRCRLFP